MPRRRFKQVHIAAFALASFLILVAGGLTIRLNRQIETPASVSPDRLQLESLTQRRSVENIADYFAQVASQVEGSVVLLSGTGHSGIVWQGGEVITSAGLGPFPSMDRTALGNREVELTTTLASPRLPFVLLEAPLDAAVSDRRPVRLYRNGAWLLGVWRSRAGGLRYTAGNLFGVTDGSCGDNRLPVVQTNLDLRSMQPGSGIFSLDGGLLAIVLDCSGNPIAAEARALEVRAYAEPTLLDQLAGRYGMAVGSASEAELRHFGRAAGVLVQGTWWGYRAHEAGLMPGDLILALEDTSVESVDDLRGLVLPVSREVHELRIWRATRERTVRMLARAATEAGSTTGGFVGRDDGLPIESVIPGSLAEHVGARPGDRLLAVNQVPAGSFSDVEAAFAAAGGQPVHVVLERHGRSWGALVGPDE